MKLGIIGGSGLYDIEGIEDVRRVAVKTPFGSPSDEYVHGRLSGVEVFFLPRHGRGHRLLPSEINHKANVCGFKMLGVERVVSVSAVGSLKEELKPRDIVLPDQYFDRTKGSMAHTFFGRGVVAHVGFGEPACPELHRAVSSAAAAEVRAAGLKTVQVASGGTYVCMEGPAFSTKAESRVYRHLGFDVIGMTSLPEAKLCREAELCYQAMAMVTDYDCWHESEESVTVEMILGHLHANVLLAKAILRRLATALPPARGCACGDALKTALLTDLASVPKSVAEELRPILGKYLPRG